MTEPACPQKSPIKRELSPGTYWWCACGRSHDQPFCDGSHKGSGFSPVKYVAQAEATVVFCACKRSAKAPLCDGTHSSL